MEVGGCVEGGAEKNMMVGKLAELIGELKKLPGDEFIDGVCGVVEELFGFGCDGHGG